MIPEPVTHEPLMFVDSHTSVTSTPLPPERFKARVEVLLLPSPLPLLPYHVPRGQILPRLEAKTDSRRSAWPLVTDFTSIPREFVYVIG